eukprot:1194122-Prorocentrum_minimum.AAC.1
MEEQMKEQQKVGRKVAQQVAKAGKTNEMDSLLEAALTGKEKGMTQEEMNQPGTCDIECEKNGGLPA